jgi:hypothetical protein
MVKEIHKLMKLIVKFIAILFISITFVSCDICGCSPKGSGPIQIKTWKADFNADSYSIYTKDSVTYYRIWFDGESTDISSEYVIEILNSDGTSVPISK